MCIETQEWRTLGVHTRVHVWFVHRRTVCFRSPKCFPLFSSAIVVAWIPVRLSYPDHFNTLSHH